MALPRTYKTFRRSGGDFPQTIVPKTELLPSSIGENDVLIKMRFVSLNYRDVAILHNRYVAPATEEGIPASDCAAEVIAVGTGVKQFKAGDRVSPIFYVDFLTGEEDVAREEALGGSIDGVLSDYAVFPQGGLVHLPKHLSWAEASTITCVGVTAWNALEYLRHLTHDNYVLLEGTGGVSMFALILLADAGIPTIITSSSDDKIDYVKKIGPLVEAINYTTHPDIEAEIKRITNGKGVDLIINNIGVTSIPVNINCLRTNGSIKMIGFLDGASADWNPGALLGLMPKRGKLQGLSVGSKIDFEALNEHLEKKNISLDPLVHKIFPFSASGDAFDYLYAGKHIGKVLIQL